MITSAEPRQSAALYRLLARLSPSFPTGAFSYSHGLEAAAENGDVRDRATLQTWIAAIVEHGSGRMDADILRDAFRAALAEDAAALQAANARGFAYRASAELALESVQQGQAFMAAWGAAWKSPHPNPPPLAGRGGPGATPQHPSPRKGERGGRRESGGRAGADSDEGVCLPAVFGIAAARTGIALEDALLGYLQAFAANLMSAGLRLGIIGQTDGQRILAG